MKYLTYEELFGVFVKHEILSVRDLNRRFSLVYMELDNCEVLNICILDNEKYEVLSSDLNFDYLHGECGETGFDVIFNKYSETSKFKKLLRKMKLDNLKVTKEEKEECNRFFFDFEEYEQKIKEFIQIKTKNQFFI